MPSAALLVVPDNRGLAGGFWLSQSAFSGQGKLDDNYDVEPVALGKGGFAVGPACD